MKKDPKIFLNHILESIAIIEKYAARKTLKTFLSSLKDQDAVVRRIEIIGEATKSISEEFKIKHQEIPWKRMAGMRDVLIHEYFIVDLTAVWGTVQEDLPALKKQIKNLIASL